MAIIGNLSINYSSLIAGFFDGFSNRSAMRLLPSRSISLVTWNEDVQVDPLLIGSSIEEYIQRGDCLEKLEEKLEETPGKNSPKERSCSPSSVARKAPLTISIHRKKKS